MYLHVTLQRNKLEQILNGTQIRQHLQYTLGFFKCQLLFTDFRGKMSIWLKTFLLVVVFNEVQLYRQLKNSTCLELAKPSNHQFRLACNDTFYHCLLDENYTKEYEICKIWTWIPEGTCTV